MTAAMPGPAALTDADFRQLADHLLALGAHPVATLAAAGQLDQAVVALMGDVPNPWRGLLLR